MFSKNADLPATVRNHWSITARLAFLYTLSAIATMVTVAVFFIWSLRDNMYKVENDFLADRLRVYRSILESRPNYLQIIQSDINWEGAYAELPEYFTRILTGDGGILLETPGMSRVIPAVRFPPNVQRGRISNGRNSVCRAANGRSYMLKAMDANGFGGDGRRILQLAVDITNAEAAIADKEQIIVVFFLLGIMLATGVGVIVARQALSPLTEITAVAEQITIARINMRTDPERWPKELRSLAGAFNGMLQRLEESFKRLSQFSDNLAHELRTPLNSLLIESEVVLARPRTADEYRRTIESGMEEYQRLSQLIDTMLFLARAENPATSILRVRFDAATEVARNCSFFEAMADEHNSTIAFHGTGHLCGDRLMFNRAISNLLANALYYSPSGAEVEIAVNQEQDGSLVVTVTDTGYGIAAEELSQIFDRFYRSEKMRASHPEGSGLGMSIVKSIMDLHGGSIAIESKVGEGTRVTLRFPVIAKETPVP